MAKNARFYILTEQSSRGTEQLACDLAASAWRLGKRVLIACETERQALDIDEALWQRDPEEFVPHNLSGEATQYVTPIEISWKGKRNAQRRDLLILFPPKKSKRCKRENVINNCVCKDGSFRRKMSSDRN